MVPLSDEREDEVRDPRPTGPTGAPVPVVVDACGATISSRARRLLLGLLLSAAAWIALVVLAGSASADTGATSLPAAALDPVSGLPLLDPVSGRPVVVDLVSGLPVTIDPGTGAAVPFVLEDGSGTTAEDPAAPPTDPADPTT